MDKKLRDSLDKKLRDSLSLSLKTNINQNTDFIWIGIIETPNARKYKFEFYWFNSINDYEVDEDIEFHIANCNSRMCLSVKQAYANAYHYIRNTLEEASESKIIIMDLTAGEND